MTWTCRCLNCITPPHILKKLLESKDRDVREAALNTLLATAQLRGERSVRAALAFAAAAPTDGRRSIFDCKHSTFLGSAVLARTEQGDASADQSVNRAFEGFGATREFYKTAFDRNSIDGRGMRLDGYVHRGTKYNNAFWDGQEMVFGDGDGVVFTDFTKSLDVIAHELTHGVTEHTAGLEYRVQSGALNESMSDVFGSLVKQWSLGQTADEADWLIGAEVFTPNVEADALRSMKAPGMAYDNETLGKDPQPDHWNKFVPLPDTEEGDWGGVHINSGIPNKAFYLTAVGIGGSAWEAPGHIWYESLKASGVTTQFQEFADTTYFKAGQLYGAGSDEQQAVLAAWREVGIRISGVPAGVSPGRGRGAPAGRARRGPANGDGGAGREADTLAALAKQVEALAAQVKVLAKDVRTVKGKK
jgi:Zn-dependent metalloprotease